MKREDIDWSVIKGSLIGVALSCVFASVLVGSSFYFKGKMDDEFRLNNSRFRSISQRYLAIDEEEKLIKNYYPPFLDLHEQGIIGREQRLDWLEVLRSAGNEIAIPSLSYDIQSQSAYTPPFPINLGQYQLYKSTMKLNARLLHEGDIFRLLKLLDDNAKGAYSISSCKLNSAGKDLNSGPGAVNVIAECTLEWFTIKFSDGRDIEV